MPVRVRALVLAAALGLTAGCFSEPEPEGPRVGPEGFSLLTEAGIAHVEQTGRMRFDLRDLRVTRQEVGVQPGRLGPQVGSPRDRLLELELVGPRGTERARTSTVVPFFNSSRDRMTSVTWFESYDTRAEGDAALARAVEHWGLPDDTVASWQEGVELATSGPFADPESTHRTSFGVGLAASGLVGEITARTTPAREGETLQLSVYLEPRYYADASLDGLRRQRASGESVRR
ncbi:hypothetical protein [Nocardioides aurantiacus]|uniref:Lipoprotein n=1 Tax=Nocardioides aurantiacus TaxID=86796 RepID=A0A3N2CSZ4_9ACTN|nr:hypothetical protein [Nocardioides aurantiacus]ROR90649.1 hypothetical protein EDD33_1496 [Nocardioides aurantiacus]